MNKVIFTLISLFLFTTGVLAQSDAAGRVADPVDPLIVTLVVLALVLLVTTVFYFVLASGTVDEAQSTSKNDKKKFDTHKILSNFNKKQLHRLIDNMKAGNKTKIIAGLLMLFLLQDNALMAQSSDPSSIDFKQGGIIITLILISLPIIAGIIIGIFRVQRTRRRMKAKRLQKDAEQAAAYLSSLPQEQLDKDLTEHDQMLDYQLEPGVLSGNLPPKDDRGILKNINENVGIRFVMQKKRAIPRPEVDQQLSKLVLWYIICSTIWLIFGTTVGEYLGIKFIAPDVDHQSWLGFGRLRPVHTNSVFWGWASLAMMGLAYYSVPRVGNNRLYSVKWGWWALWLINLSVLLGSITLMMGINNSGGEFREYIWPIQALFGLGVILTLMNFVKTIARRKVKEIYVSNWYIVAALMFGVTIMVVAYLPFWQNGLGETITQGYYMHMGVGMWFMMMVLGLVYYYLPQQLNKPIYSYSLGILAFWTQILFYTEIGSHHFVFSSIPWWLQTVAIVGSVGMAIPVIAGTTNFLMTFKGSWHKLSGSYTLPFMLVGIIFYFTGSLQGSAEALRTTNLYWHFTDFTVAHSHMTMYGIITFFLWGFIYAVVPRLTRNEPPQPWVGIHFWMAFIGLMFYIVALMIGGTLRGMSWMAGNPFIESVKLMAPYWLWRAIGGSLMWLSHLVFAYNLYKMIKPDKELEMSEEIIAQLETSAAVTKENN